MGQLGAAGGRRAVAVPRESGVIGFFALDEEGAAEVCSRLRETQPLIEREAGDPVLTGVGHPCRSLEAAVTGLEGAEAALAMASPRRSFVALPTMGLVEYAAGRVDPTLRRAATVRLAGFADADDRARGALSETVRAYVQANRNSRAAAKILHCHYNTVNYRIEKIHRLTGLDPNDMAELMDLHLGLLVAESGNMG